MNCKGKKTLLVINNVPSFISSRFIHTNSRDEFSWHLDLKIPKKWKIPYHHHDDDEFDYFDPISTNLFFFGNDMNSNGSIHLDVFIIFLPFGKIKFRKGMNRDTKGTNYALIDLIDTERERDREREIQ